MNGNHLNPNNIEFVNVCHVSDHRKGKCWFTTKFIIKVAEEKYYDIMYSLAEVKCKNNSSKIVNKKILDEIDLGVNRVASARVKFTK